MTFEGGGGGFFLPETSGDRMFFADIQSHCVAGISLQEFLFARNQSAEYCFLKHPYPPPFKSQMAGPQQTTSAAFETQFLCSFDRHR